MAAKTEKKVTEQKAEDLSVLDKLADSLRKGRNRAVLSGVDEALEKGYDPQAIISDGLVKGMMLLGEDFTASRAFVPEMLVAAKCMTSALDVLKPLLKGDTIQKKGRICLGTVKGDMHDIGKNLVKIMLEGGGFEVVDLGVDVPAERFVETAIEEKCDIIACSALLTTTMSEMRRVVELSTERGIRDKVRIMVGGAPVTQAFCDEIGADGYADDAAQGVLLAEKLMEK
ncbi:MAG: corrinoid protein [Oscillospiraceae bacterium]|nr:corrinoid protein [Oscillospiraceae bacterium]